MIGKIRFSGRSVVRRSGDVKDGGASCLSGLPLRVNIGFIHSFNLDYHSN